MGTPGNFWYTIDGKSYWYENWVRQGWQPSNANYRGKEIYDPASGAWYWLDSVQQGAKAVSRKYTRIPTAASGCVTMPTAYGQGLDTNEEYLLLRSRDWCYGKGDVYDRRHSLRI